MKTECPAGHPYDAENTYLAKDNRRRCRACQRERHAREKRESPDLVLQRGRESSLRWKARHPDLARAAEERQKLRKYGLTVTDYQKMFDAQGGVCAICKDACPSGRRLAVDHDAPTGKVRGLLCMNCNNGIGRFGHDLKRLLAAAEYLTKTVTLT